VIIPSTQNLCGRDQSAFALASDLTTQAYACDAATKCLRANAWSILIGNEASITVRAIYLRVVAIAHKIAAAPPFMSVTSS